MLSKTVHSDPEDPPAPPPPNAPCQNCCGGRRAARSVAHGAHRRPGLAAADHAGDWPVEVALSALPDVVRWTRYPPDLDEEGARARIETRTEGAVAGRGGRYVVRDASGTVAGTAVIAMNSRHAPEVFYALLPQGRGRGLATTATIQLTDWALGIGHDVVLLMTMVGNTASEAVARRAGFRAAAVETAGVKEATVQLRRWERTR